MPSLKVIQADMADVFSDHIRINEKHRLDKKGNLIKARKIVKLKCNNKECFCISAGLVPKEGNVIKIDEVLRDKLNIKTGKEYKFELKPCGLLGEFLWALNASNPSYRISSWLGIISIILGFIGLSLGIISLIK
ncbi:MAG: hypothetical protein A2014_08410 [Spirochaetes bacterium GWF1_49_6]|nr:MAG: hypothetical protein A2014_08410 [Spirochaetes bacterium GWF1_49_6]